MSFNLIAYPLLIQRQAAAPTITSSSVLWRDTDDNALYFSDGSSWQQFSSATDAQGWETAVAQVILEILRLSAEGTLTAPDYDSMFVDYFADSGGQDNTIDLGNTNALFDTDSYKAGANATEATSLNLASSTGTSTYMGYIISAANSCSVISVTKHASCTATHAYIQDSSGTPIDNAAFDGNVATFSTPVALTASTEYRVLAASGGAAYTRQYIEDSVSYPIAGTNISYVHGWDGEEETGANNITQIVTFANDGSEVNVQTNAQALSFSPAYILIHEKDKTLSGNGAISYDVSFDGGSTWDSTDNDLDVKTAVTDGSSKNMIVKFNLEGTGTALFKDYEVILWSS